MTSLNYLMAGENLYVDPNLILRVLFHNSYLLSEFSIEISNKSNEVTFFPYDIFIFTPLTFTCRSGCSEKSSIDSLKLIILYMFQKFVFEYKM